MGKDAVVFALAASWRTPRWPADARRLSRAARARAAGRGEIGAAALWKREDWTMIPKATIKLKALVIGRRRNGWEGTSGVIPVEWSWLEGAGRSTALQGLEFTKVRIRTVGSGPAENSRCLPTPSARIRALPC